MDFESWRGLLPIMCVDEGLSANGHTLAPTLRELSVKLTGTQVRAG
jgi:hypothetical protein